MLAMVPVLFFPKGSSNYINKSSDGVTFYKSRSLIAFTIMFSDCEFDVVLSSIYLGLSSKLCIDIVFNNFSVYIMYQYFCISYFLSFINLIYFYLIVLPSSKFSFIFWQLSVYSNSPFCATITSIYLSIFLCSAFVSSHITAAFFSIFTFYNFFFFYCWVQ